MAVLIIFPGFKSAFSDVIGYFAIAGGATELFANIMDNQDLNSKIAAAPDDQKQGLKSAADAIIKLLGNKTILINQITPDNFVQMWHMLTPLMKDDVKNDSNGLGTQSRGQLLALVVLKDNIGEAFWYIYTAILISSIVYYNLANRGCVKSVEQIKAGYDDYLKKQEETEKQNAENTTTAVITPVFTLTGGRVISGDLMYTTSGKLLLTSGYFGSFYLTQYDYSTTTLEVDLNISAYATTPYGIFQDSGLIYVLNSTGNIYNIPVNSPYTPVFVQTVPTGGSYGIFGASQVPSCLTANLI